MSAIINGIEVLTPSDLKKISQILPQVTATDSLLLVVEQTDGTGANTSVGSIRATLIPATQKGLANGVATLGADGKIPASQLPALAVVDVYPVASEAAMLACAAEQGDIAVRTDSNQVFILAASPASTLANWVELSALKALVDAAIAEVKGEGYTEGSLKSHEDRLDTLEGVVDTNRLYSDSQYLALKAKAYSLQVKCNTLQAEVYTDAPILQYGAVEIIGDGYEADATPIDVSSNVVDGSLALEQKGLTITNLVKNGDFSAGFVAPWVSVNAGTPSVASKVCSFTATAQSGRIEQSMNLTAGHVYWFSVRVKATTASAGDVAAYMIGSSGGAYISNHTGSGEYEILTLRLTLVVGGATSKIRITDNRASGWSQIDVDGEYGVKIVDLTALGLSSITDTAILAKLLPYVDGTQNVGKMGMQILSKNFFDNNMYSFGDFYTDPDGALAYNATYRAYRVRVGANAQITFKRNDGLGNLEASGGIIRFENKSNQLLSANSSGFNASSVTFTTPATCQYMVFSISKTVDIPSRLYQLEYSATATPYVPYQEQLTFLPAIGNSLPNGVADSIKTVADGWEHTKRIQEHVLQSADIVSVENSAYAGELIVTTIDTKKVTGYSYAPVGYIEHSVYPFYKGNISVSSAFGYYINGVGILRLTAPLNTWTDVASARAALAGTVIYYQLATPITTHYNLPHLTSGKTIHRFAGEEKIALYGTGLAFSENVLAVLSAVKFVAGEMTDITSLATITGATVTFSGVSATDVVYVMVEHSVNRPLGILEHTPAVSNTASRLASLEARVSALEV